MCNCSDYSRLTIRCVLSLLFYLSLLYSLAIFFLMIRRPPRSTRTDTLFPYTTLFRSGGVFEDGVPNTRGKESLRVLKRQPDQAVEFAILAIHLHHHELQALVPAELGGFVDEDAKAFGVLSSAIGRAHV